MDWGAIVLGALVAPWLPFYLKKRYTAQRKELIPYILWIIAEEEEGRDKWSLYTELQLRLENGVSLTLTNRLLREFAQQGFVTAPTDKAKPRYQITERGKTALREMIQQHKLEQQSEKLPRNQ